MTGHTIEFAAHDLPDAPGQIVPNALELDMPAPPEMLGCRVAPVTVLEYHGDDAWGAAGWEISPAAALSLGTGIWAAATGAAFLLALG